MLDDFFVGIVAPRFQLLGQIIRLPPERKLGKQGDLHFFGFGIEGCLRWSYVPVETLAGNVPASEKAIR